MKKRILAFFLMVLLAVCLILSACGEYATEETDGKLTMYTVGEHGDALNEFVKKYNKYCAVNDCFEDSVEFIYFDDYTQLNDTLSTELMAGKGPDILSLTQSLPFEKLVSNKSLADIDRLLSDSSVNINFDDYNKTIMDSGVVNGKRVLLPLYYSVDVLFTTQERLEEFGIDIEKENISQIANKINSENIDTHLVCPYSADSFYFSFIRNFIDLEKGTTDFDSEEFRQNAETFKKALLNSKAYADLSNFEFPSEETHSDFLFSCNEFDFYGGSFTDIAEIYHNTCADGVTPVICPDFSRNGEISANVEIGFGINANCKKTEKAAKFIEYLLSDSSQGYFAGAREDVLDEVGLSLPVKNSVFESAFSKAKDYNWYYPEDDADAAAMKENANEFLEKEYLPLVQSVKQCHWYGKSSQLSSYLYQNVARITISDYLKDKITLDKFSDKLSSSFNMYINE